MRQRFQIAGLLIASLTALAHAQIMAPASTASNPVLSAASDPLAKPVARVNGAVLTNRDLLREEYAIFPYAKQHGGKIPPEMEPEIRDGALKMIVFEELVYQEERKRGFAITPAQLSRAEADFRKHFESPAEYRYFVHTEFQGSENLMREKITRSLLIDRYLKAAVESKSTVTLAELRGYYEKNPAHFQYPESFAIQTISIIPPPSASREQLKQARLRATDALGSAKATKTAEEFGLLAEKISEDDYRVMMGDHNWVSREKMPPAMLEAASKMQVGQVSDLIQVDGNYVIFRMNRHVPAGKVGLDEIKDRLRAELQKQKANELRAELDNKLRKNAKIETL